MNIVFLSHYFYPHIGGVEKHTMEVAKEFKRKGNNVSILTEKYNKYLMDEEVWNGIKIFRFEYPHIKYLGLIFIWFSIFRKIKLIIKSDIIHIHDIFIWYLPFKFLVNKPLVTTFHGWEGKWPLPSFNILIKKLANKYSDKTIAIGRYVEKYYQIKTNMITYGGTKNSGIIKLKKNKNNIVFLGRLEQDTGVVQFLNWIKKSNNKYVVNFCGDGPYKKECAKYGTVRGFINPEKFLSVAHYCVPGGYLAALEALAANCELKLFWGNKLKEDYWKMSPFVEKDVKLWAKSQTWEKLANEYLDLYNNI